MELDHEKEKNIAMEGIAPPRTRNVAVPFISEAVLARLILVLAMASGAFLRIWQINAIGYNTDEAVYSGQAAAIAGVPGLKDIFPVFRAHPLLFQFVLSLIYKFSFNDLSGRLLAAAIGLATIYLTYELGKTLYGRLPGAFAALFLALMPYHVVVSRQVLLDGPMVFFSTLTLYVLARFAKTQRVGLLYAAGICMGLTFLSKETSIVMLGSIYTFLALTPEVRVRFRDLIIAPILMAIVIAPFPLSLLAAGGSSTGRNYLIWQLFRRPNHDWPFYLQTVPFAIGVLVVAAAILGLVLLWKERSWREKLLLSWILIPTLFFQIWPVKGFQYLLPIAPPLALLAGRLLGKYWTRVRTANGNTVAVSRLSIPPLVSWLAVVAVVISLAFSSWQRIQPAMSSLFLAGTGGVPGGRETGLWIQSHVPQYAEFMTIGPSMANILQFYGQRKAFGLAISPNPLHRNPSYEPILNPDSSLRSSDMQYLVWDSFSAQRTPFFSDKLMGYVNKYNGRAIHTESITFKDAQGNLISKPIIIIYEVRP
ncbi:MAG: ArnT family glycosyltransferase [Anaerolineales bacterium]